MLKCVYDEAPLMRAAAGVRRNKSPLSLSPVIFHLDGSQPWRRLLTPGARARRQLAVPPLPRLTGLTFEVVAPLEHYVVRHAQTVL